MRPYDQKVWLRRQRDGGSSWCLSRDLQGKCELESLYYVSGICFKIIWGGKLLSHPASLQPHGLYHPQNSPGQDTRVGNLPLLQGIFPTQGSNQGLPRCRQILYQLNHQESPRILEWVAYSFSRGFSWPRR